LIISHKGEIGLPRKAHTLQRREPRSDPAF
jgi:hypothetical protein